MFLKRTNIEPAFLVFCIGWGLMLSTRQTFAYFKVCVDMVQEEQPLEDPVRFCESVASLNASDFALRVQSTASIFDMYTKVAFSLTSVVTTVALSSYSDAHGRKPPLVLAGSGHVLCFVIYTAVATWPLAVSRRWLIAAFALSGATGGIQMIIAGSFSSILDTTKDPKHRTVRIAIAESLLPLGMVVGCGSSAFLTGKGVGYTWLLMGCTAAFSTGVLLVAIAFKETRPPTPVAGEREVESCGFVKSILHEYKAMALLLVKPRPGLKRVLLLVACYVFFVAFAVDMGCSDLKLLFFKHVPLSWTDAQYDVYLTVSNAVLSVSTVSLVALFREVFRLSDILITLIGFTFLMLQYIWQTFTNADWMVYLGLVPMGAGYVCYPAIRVFIASQTDENEHGKTFGLIAVLQVVGFLLSSVLFQNLYAVTEATFVGSVYAVGAGIFLHVVIVTGVHFNFPATLWNVVVFMASVGVLLLALFAVAIQSRVIYNNPRLFRVTADGKRFGAIPYGTSAFGFKRDISPAMEHVNRYFFKH